MLTNIVHCCDCMEFMAGCKDGEFDLAIVDPPYGINWDYERKGMSSGIRKDGTKRIYNKWSDPTPKNYKAGNYDSEPPSADYFKELLRISNLQIIWGGHYFTDKLPVSGGWIVWDKGVVMPTLSKCELAWTNTMEHIEKFTYLWAGFRKAGEHGERNHVNQKPVALYKWLLKNYAKPSWKIFDSHVGSGSSRIACYDMGFDYVGCELDADYWQAQEKRFNDYIQQKEIFDKKEIQESIFNDQGELF